jgi:hypothetical protein
MQHGGYAAAVSNRSMDAIRRHVSEQRDVIEILTEDHREVERMFAELESLRGADRSTRSLRR